ncbi:hypothetical protein Hanom_Chr00s000001g01593121 [Helianthus anomalus]
MKEKNVVDELKILTDFKATCNEWFTKEEKKKRSRKTTPKVQVEEGSSSQPKKKRQKKVVETLLVDEPEEEEPEADAEGDYVRLSPESEQLLKSLKESFGAEKAVGENEGDNEEKSSSSSSESEINETERLKRIKADIEKEKQLKRKRREEKDDDLYILSPEHVQDTQTPPSSGGLNKPIQELSQPPSTPPAPQQQPSPHQSPPPPPQPDPIPSPPKQQSLPHSLSQIHISTPTHEQPVITSQHILQTPPTTQPQVQTTPSSSGFKDFPRLIDREKKLEKCVKTAEAENSSLLKRIEADQADIDILKVRIAELDEEKARRDEQNEYFKLKNKELEATNAKKEHEMYMMNKVLENLIGKPVEQMFEEIELEEVRARRKAEIEAEMKNKGKGIQVEGVSVVTERTIVPAVVLESPIQNPRPISAVSSIFEEDIEVDDVVNEDEEDDEDEEEEEDDEAKKDDADDVFSASSHDNDNGNDDDDQGTSGIKVTEESNEENVDDYLQDDANEEPENAESEIWHTYTLDEIIKLTHIDENEFKFDFEEELNEFDINQQHEYEYKYVEEANNYDRVEVEEMKKV